MARFRVGVDIGGTFTDIVFLGPDGQIHTKKVSSSVDNYARAIVEGLRELFQEAGLRGEDVAEVIHGTTITSNAILEEEAVLQVRADRRTFRPYGLYGGSPGRPGWNILNPDTERRVLSAKVTTTIRRGDVFRHEQPGPGGWGDPLEREPGRVLRDVRNELVSLESARADYGVAIDPETLTVDEATTARLRAELRAARGWVEVPKVIR